jgi:innexin
MQLGEFIGELRNFVNKHDDDVIDRYNHRYTVVILILFIIIIASKQYYGDPIVCWVPATFTKSQNAYANTVW